MNDPQPNIHSVPQNGAANNAGVFDLHQLLEHPALRRVLINLHREGSSLAAACPKCGGKDRFFTGPAVGFRVWHCRQCKHSVHTSALLGVTYAAPKRPTVQDWNDAAPLPSVLAAVQEVYEALTVLSIDALLSTPHAIDYLHRRGIDKRHAIDAKLGYMDSRLYTDWWNKLLPADQRIAHEWAGLPEGGDRLFGHGAMFAAGYRGKIVFPYFDTQGHVTDIRTRSISPSDTAQGKTVRYTSPRLGQRERGALAPFGIDRLTSSLRIVLTEGEFKSLTPWSAGLPFPILALRGVDDLIGEFLPHLRSRLVVLAFDNDQNNGDKLSAGQSATVRIGRLLDAASIDVVVANPANMGALKGIDDYVQAEGVDALAGLLTHTLTLSEYEGTLPKAMLDSIPTPRADKGVSRFWVPAEKVDHFAQAQRNTMSLDDAQEMIRQSIEEHFRSYRRGNSQLVVTATAGAGKTTEALAASARLSSEVGGTTAVFLPSHSTIDEKIADGTLAGYKHVYGRRWDDTVKNCEQADSAQALSKKGYSPSVVLCPTCPALRWCSANGYKSQFRGTENRAYVHSHLWTDYPEGEDRVIVDELSHKQFIGEQFVGLGDLQNTLQNASIVGPQREMLNALLRLYTAPNLADLEGAVFYERLRRELPNLADVDAWGNGSLVQEALDLLASTTAAGKNDGSRNVFELEELPDQFGKRLFAALSEDVRRINAGQQPTGRLRLIVRDKHRALHITYSLGRLPGWYTKRPTVILNATGDDVLTDLVGPVKVVAPQVSIAEGNTIVQDLRWNNAKSGYVGDSIEARNRRNAWTKHIDSYISDESDTTIITTKVLAENVRQAFPSAKIAWYGALEGRNDLQAGTLILANPPAVNMDAVMREASALWPGINTTLTRSITAYDVTNAAGAHLAVEQIDGLDPRVQTLIWQHRDALVVQAVQRARLVRNTGVKVVAMFARPIPGMTPTTVITEREQKPSSVSPKLIEAALSMPNGFTLSMLASAAGVARKTAWERWGEVVQAAGMVWQDMPAIQPLANNARRSVEVRVALPVAAMGKYRLHVVTGHYQKLVISLRNDVQPILPAGWEIDHFALSVRLAEYVGAKDEPEQDIALPDLSEVVFLSAQQPFSMAYTVPMMGDLRSSASIPQWEVQLE